MKTIYVATKSRGFLVNLFNSEIENIQFIYQKNRLYETNSRLKLFLSKMVKSRLADHLGLIKRLKVDNSDADFVFSYNRFLKSKNKYVIYLENPLALVHYSTGRNKTLLGRIKLKKYLNDPNLEAIVCLSKACYETLNSFYSIPERVKIQQVYPFIKKNEFTNEESIKQKCHQDDIHCLYVSSNFNLKGGQDILECFRKFKNSGINNIRLKIITQLESLDVDTRKEIEENSSIDIYDFNFNKKELNKIYNTSCILLNPTRQDSFSLVVLEAMKSGNSIISTDLYAIPEMVKSNENGYLTAPRYRFFEYDNMPNESVWNNRKQTIYSDYIDQNVVNFLFDKLTSLNNDRNNLERLAINAFKQSITGEFSEEYIKEKWCGIFNNIQ
ncbi:glycosyltransferase [Lysinibacillus fusiformis]|nr:glycosyltransferase [Lysinibacillus fusiformis]